MTQQFFSILLCAGLLSVSGKQASAKESPEGLNPVSPAIAFSKDSVIVYQSDNLIIKKLSDHVYQHISFLLTNSFGKVDCNGMIVVNKREAIVFDTPADEVSSRELINYLSKELNCIVNAIIPTHFHEDCVGGLEAFYAKNIPAYASSKTIELLKNKGTVFSKTIRSFNNSLVLNIGDKKVYAEYFGEGHTKDNIIGYFPEDKAVFGGCLIKEVNATKGYLGDANTAAWPGTVNKLKQKYPQTKIVIPGHGKSGGVALFDYTIKLFQ